jgi:hypothetical protein
MELTVRRSRRELIIAIIIAIGLWLVYAFIGPGDDYKRAYTDMVIHPEQIAEVPERTWTLNPLWQNWFMAPFVTMPGRWGYLAFMAFTLGATIWAAYLFGGRPVLVVLSSHMAWILWWGQLEGWAALGLVLGYYALQNRTWLLMWVALMMATFKPQASLIPVATLWWWLGREKWKAAAAMVATLIVTVIVWGPWPWWYWQALSNFVGDRHYDNWNASIGLIALPLFIPALLVPLTRQQRLIALTATACLAITYMPYYSTILLLCMAVPWWAYIFGFTGYLVFFLGPLGWNIVALLPASLLVWIYWPIARDWYRRRKHEH